MIILETKNLTKRFNGIHAVDRLSIGIERGQITGIIGPNGSGKTTLINLLSGVLEIDGGEVIIDETEKFTPLETSFYKFFQKYFPSRTSTNKFLTGFTRILPHQVSFYGITRTFQNVRLFEQMTVFDNILVVVTERNVFSSLFEKHTKYHHEIAKEVLQKVGLWEKENQLAVNLSYGQRKLLEIARTLAMKAEIYLFDEPLAGLFPEMRKIVSGIIRELKQENKTVILVEHNMGLIRELCDFIFVMDEGKLLAEGKPEQVLEKRGVINAYLGE